MTRITASITAYSAISCPSCSLHNLRRCSIDDALQIGPKMSDCCKTEQRPVALGNHRLSFHRLRLNSFPLIITRKTFVMCNFFA
jgi:hypothetical protein